MERAVVVAVTALLGAAFGSFLTVVIHRMPRKESIVLPGSACPQCGTPIRARDNVPVVSYLLLRGRCRSCRTPISAEYPIMEIFTAALFVAALAAFRTWVAVMIGPFLGLMLAVAMIDARFRIVPNRLVLPSLGVFAAVVAVLRLTHSGVSPVSAVLALVAYGGALFAIALAVPGGMGMGDVKLAALIGLVLGSLGWRYLGVAAMLAVLGGGVAAMFSLIRGRGRKDLMPFGPYMAGGAVVSALFAPQIVSWYLGLVH